MPNGERKAAAPHTSRSCSTTTTCSPTSVLRPRGRRRTRYSAGARLAPAGSLGVVVPFFALAAATFDASENVALLLTLEGNGANFVQPFAAVCSAIKFTLIGIAIVCVVCGTRFGRERV